MPYSRDSIDRTRKRNVNKKKTRHDKQINILNYIITLLSS